MVRMISVGKFGKISGGRTCDCVSDPRHAFDVFGPRKHLTASPQNLIIDDICPMMEGIGRRGIKLDNVRYKLVIFANHLVSKLLSMNVDEMAWAS